MNKEQSDAIAQRICLMVGAVYDTAEALHRGDIQFEIGENTPTSLLRWTPKVAVRPQPDDPASVPFTMAHVARRLNSTENMGKGQRKASDLVRLAFRIIELSETNRLTNTSVTKLIKGGKGLRVSSLIKDKKLRALSV